MLAQVLQIFFGKEHLLKHWLISTLDKVIYFKIGWRTAENNSPFFQTYFFCQL
jgi:hypothetical protein